MVAALRMIILRSLPRGKKQLVEKVVNFGEHIIDPTDTSAPEDQSEVVEEISLAVARYSATDTIRRMDAMHKKACCCLNKTSETMTLFIKRFVSAAQAYTNIENAVRK